MPRRARLAIPGIPWHIIQRGNNRSTCFYADDDYRYYLQTLNQPRPSVAKPERAGQRLAANETLGTA